MDEHSEASWPAAPWCRLATWEGRGGRLRLPPARDGERHLAVCSVGPGWMELADDPDSPGLPVSVEAKSADRLTIEGAGVLKRFGAAPGDEVLMTAVPSVGGWLIRVVAADCLEQALRDPTVRPMRLWTADGFWEWRRRVLGGD